MITRNFRIWVAVILPGLPSNRRPARMLGLLAAAAVILAGCGSGRSKPGAPVKPSGLISIFESNQLLVTPGQTLDRLRALGVQYVRVLVRWRSVAPDASSSTPPSHFDAASPAAYPAAGWAPYDAIDRDARERHMAVLFDVAGGAPNWAMGPGAPRAAFVPGVWKPSPSRFGAFAQAVGARYSGSYTPPGASSPLPRVSFWSIWNEPNLGEADLAPQSIDDSRIETSALMYRQLLDAAWAALGRSGHAGDTILIGDLAPYGEQSPATPTYPQGLPGIFGYMLPLQFLRALYCVDSRLHQLRGGAAALRGCPTTAAGSREFARQHPALFRASGFAMHPYPSGGVPPNAVLPVDDPDFVYLATLSRLTRFLDRVTARYGSPRRYPIYSTEYGYLTSPPYCCGAPLALAAAYLNEAEYMSWRNPRLRSWDQYLLTDPPPYADSKFVSGLEFASGAPKPSFYAYRLPIYLPATAQQRGSSLEVWGCLRPAYYAPSDHQAQIQLQRGGQGPFQTIKSVLATGPGCYFDVRVRFPSGGKVRVAWSYPRGSTIYSRLVTITVR